METPAHAAAPPSKLRPWLFRLGAVALALLPFVVAELVCIAAGWGRPVDRDDPFVGFRSVSPLFVLSGDGERFEIAPARKKFFADDSFPAHKADKEYRVFCLGGSTVQGRPYSVPTSFTTWLELGLTAADDSRQWEVVNCGGISYASYRLVPILEECLQHQPDLILLCTGHNEFLEDRSYAHIKHTPELLARPLEFLANRRVVVFASSLLEPDAPADDRTLLAGDADAMLDYHNGLAAYHRDDAWRDGVIRHFEFNVRRMLALCREAGVPVILLNEPSNLADQPPFKSEPSTLPGSAERERFDELLARAADNYRTDLPAAIQSLEAALEIDPRYAAAWYQLGKCREALQQHETARAAFIRARDEDVCPLRILSSMEQILHDIVAEERLQLIDMHALLEQQTPGRALGDRWLVDHVHPSIEGHQLVANELITALARQDIVHPDEGWQTRAEQAYAGHLQSISPAYFVRAETTVGNVRAWSRGQSDGPPAANRFPHRIQDRQ